MSTAAEMRTALSGLKAKIAAKFAELTDTTPDERVVQIEAEHAALITEHDALATREQDATAAEARAARPNLETPVTHYGAAARAPGAERATRMAAMENALMHRANPGVALTDAGRDYRGFTLAELGRECLEAEGRYERGMSKSEVATRSLQSTSDFPQILANVTSKTLRAAYTASPRTFMPFSKRVDLKDFRPSYRVQLGAAPQLEEILENGEYKRGSMNEGHESWKLRTFGKVVGITRQVILNDDVGAFTDLPGRLGVQAANLESDLVWSMILSNPVLQTDGQPVFSAAHHNVGTGPASALLQGNPAVPTPAAIAAARVAMAKQLDLDGRTILNLRPSFIVVPPELEIATQQVLFGIVPNQVAAVVPEAIRSLTPISEPRLSLGAYGQAGSATGWYLFAAPATAETVIYSYLDGAGDGPYTETRNGFDVDGVEVKVRHDFGATMTDFRGAYRNAGA